MAGRITVPVKPEIGGIRETTKAPPPLCREDFGTLAVVWVMGRGGGEEVEDRRTKDFANFRDGVQDNQGGGTDFFQDTPPPPNFQVLPVA